MLQRDIRFVVVVTSKTHTVAELTAMIGLAPDESWEMGAVFRFGSRMKRRETSAWAAVERVVGKDDPITTADRLVTRLQALVPRFQGLPTGVEVALRILVDDSVGVFGLGLDKSHVQFVAAIGAELDVSVVVAHADGNSSAPTPFEGSK